MPIPPVKTCRKGGQPGRNIVTCGRPPEKGVIPQTLKPLPENTPPTPGTSTVHLIQKGKAANFCSQPTSDNFQRLTHDQPCELCNGYGHQTKNCYITHRNSRNTFKSTNQKNTLRANQPLQLELDTEVEPDLSIAQGMVYNQVCQEYEGLIRRDSKWSAIFKRLLSGDKITGVQLVDGLLYLLHKSRWPLVIPDYLNIKSKPAKAILINQAHVNTRHAGLNKTYVEQSHKYHWQNTYTDIKEFMESCELYQLTKSSTQKPVGLLTPLNIPSRPYVEIAMNFLFLKQ